MKDPHLEEFLKIKEEVIDNLISIRTTLDECTDSGMSDPEANLYNQITDLISQAEASETLSDLEMIVVKGKDIEKMIDAWLSNQGLSSFELTWPEKFNF